jgi:hypothetical protein
VHTLDLVHHVLSFHDPVGSSAPLGSRSEFDTAGLIPAAVISFLSHSMPPPYFHRLSSDALQLGSEPPC